MKEKRSDMTQIIDGKALAAKLQGQLAEKDCKIKGRDRPSTWFSSDFGWENPQSQVYVRNKEGQPCRLVSVVKLYEFQRPLLKRNC